MFYTIFINVHLDLCCIWCFKAKEANAIWIDASSYDSGKVILLRKQPEIFKYKHLYSFLWFLSSIDW